MRFFAAVMLAATTAGLGAQHPSRRDRRIEALVAAAALVAPEFGADAMLRIAESASAGIDEAWRRDLILEAFLRAYGAQERYRRTAWGVPDESRQGANTAPTAL